MKEQMNKIKVTKEQKERLDKLVNQFECKDIGELLNRMIRSFEHSTTLIWFTKRKEAMERRKQLGLRDDKEKQH